MTKAINPLMYGVPATAKPSRGYAKEAISHAILPGARLSCFTAGVSCVV